MTWGLEEGFRWFTMGRLFLRKAHIEIGQEVGTQVGTSETVIQPDTLRVAFSVDKTATSTPNSVKCRIFNLSRKSRAKIEAPGNIITIRAGYHDDLYGTTESDTVGDSTNPPQPELLPIVTRADIRTVSHGRSGADFVTMIEASEGGVGYRNSFVSEKMEPGVTIIQVFKKLAESFENSQVNIPLKPTNRGFGIHPLFDQVVAGSTSEAKAEHLAKATAVYSSFFVQGLTLHGFTRDILDKLCARHDLGWWLDSNILTIVSLLGILPGSLIKDWGPHNGLLGVPERLENGAVKFITNMEPGLELWTAQSLKMNIETQFNGSYKLGRINHSGDTDSQGAWQSTVEGIQIG